MAKAVFEKMFESDRTAAEIVAAEGLAQIDDESQIDQLVAEVLARNADAVAAVSRRQGVRRSASWSDRLSGRRQTRGRPTQKRVNERAY